MPLQHALTSLHMCIENATARSSGTGTYSESRKSEPSLLVRVGDERSVDHDLNHIVCDIEHDRLLEERYILALRVPFYCREMKSSARGATIGRTVLRN
jgi:hypothetical protein